MFTDGLDETAIDWIKKGRDKPVEDEARIRSPLAERTGADLFPKSPLAFNGSGFMSSHVLPPLKFRSGLLTPHSLASPCLDDDDDDDGDYDVNESIASVPFEDGGAYSDDDGMRFHDSDFLEKPVVEGFDEDAFGYHSSVYSGEIKVPGISNISSINRGNLKEGLRIEVPVNLRKFPGGKLGARNFPQKFSTPNHGSRRKNQVHFHSARGPQVHRSVFEDLAGTPSAPPIAADVGSGEATSTECESQTRRDSEDSSEIDQTANGCPLRAHEGLDGCKDVLTDWKPCSPANTQNFGRTSTGAKDSHISQVQANYPDSSSGYSTSGQHAWQTLLAYDACIRLCLQAWERGCTDSPEFLRNGCLILRNAFGLHKFLLQPRLAQPTERGRNTEHSEQVVTSNPKQVVGKIRVEVKKLRLIPKRKLMNTYSQKSSIYMRAGAEYIRNISTFVKNGINSLKEASFSTTSEEQSCLFQLKSAAEVSDVECASAVCLHPSSGDYHVFFPEAPGDTLLLEIQDVKKVTQGRTMIAVSSLIDNTNDRIRWWPIYHDDQECVGKIQLSIVHTLTSDETNHMKSGPLVETLAYDLVLEAAMRAQHFCSTNLRIDGLWKWLLTEFADYYGVSSSYTRIRYLSHVMNVATPTKDCLELVNELLEPIMKAKSEKSLTRQERSILLDCETQIESLLANVFENYKSLDENSPTGLTDLLGPIKDSAAPALTPAVKIYTQLHDILSRDAQNMLRNYFQRGAKKRCRKYMVETDEFVSGNSEGVLIDPITISTAYLKIKQLCKHIGDEIQADIKIHNQHILPSSIDLSNITAAVYSTELCNRLRGFLSAWPPSGPLPYINELLVATADFERSLESWNISPVQGGVDSRNLFHNYIMVWVQDMQLTLLDLCKAEKVPWSGVSTNHSSSPFAEEMYEKIRDSLVQYEVVINRWPQYSLILENAVADVERAILKALEKQYNDILTPLKDTIPKRLNMHVQKLTRRQSMAIYSVPNQLGMFLNTIKRILDVLHIRVEGILKSWASYMPVVGDKKSLFGEQMNGITVLLRTKYKNYLQATVGKLICNMQGNRNTRLKRILEETREEEGEHEVRERMQMLSSQLTDSIWNLHEVFTGPIFVAMCRGLWDRMGQIVLKFLEGRKENRVWYNGSYYALGILDDTFASQMQRLLGNAVQEKDIDPPRSVVEARSILCRDSANATDTATYLYL
ncbi:uncharacterized protein LOC111448102 [Cucurbita moschata]|uniref:Uncharacterized protein LOC111448102 n=1 Tax=Cucurbita moschata TaxID=3662 RepID=A0A6J1FTU7_CUCMO|nr:uncharacterized protein LOC111448102 [Cucurbita moschata]